jgi:hypothetical protein
LLGFAAATRGRARETAERALDGEPRRVDSIPTLHVLVGGCLQKGWDSASQSLDLGHRRVNGVRDYTSAQARSAISAGSPQAIFAADLRNATGRRVQQATVGPIQAFMVEDTDWHVDFLVHGYVAARASGLSRGTRQTARPASRAGDALIETLNAYTYKVTYEDCIRSMIDELDGVLGPTLRSLGEADGEEADDILSQDLTDWCDRLAIGS